MATQKQEALLFASTSANLYNFMGITASETHMQIYRAVVENSLKAHHDLNDFRVDALQVIDPHHILDKISSQPFIFVTFHTGSFNMLVARLLSAGQQFYVLADTQSLGLGDYQQVGERYRQQYHNNCGLEMINVEEEGAIFRIIRKIRDQGVMLAYLDGNKGIGGQVKDNKNLMEVDFLAGRVKVRKGLPYMAFLTKVPLVLALNYHEEGQNYLRIYEPIEVDSPNRESFCKKAMTQIFQHFEDHVRKYVNQWSNWPYVHGWSATEYFQEKLMSAGVPHPEDWQDKVWHFNADRFCPLKIEEQYFLFDRVKYQLAPVSATLVPLFSRKTQTAERQKLILDLIGKSSNKATELITGQILI